MCALTPNVPISRRILVCSSNNSNSLVTPQIEILGIMEKPKALVDSGASTNFINSSFVNKHKLPRIELTKARQVQAIDVKTSLRPNSMQWETSGEVPERPRCVQVTREWMTIGSPAVAFLRVGL